MCVCVLAQTFRFSYIVFETIKVNIKTISSSSTSFVDKYNVSNQVSEVFNVVQFGRTVQRLYNVCTTFVQRLYNVVYNVVYNVEHNIEHYVEQWWHGAMIAHIVQEIHETLVQSLWCSG